MFKQYLILLILINFIFSCQFEKENNSDKLDNIEINPSESIQINVELDTIVAKKSCICAEKVIELVSEDINRYNKESHSINSNTFKDELNTEVSKMEECFVRLRNENPSIDNDVAIERIKIIISGQCPILGKLIKEKDRKDKYEELNGKK